MVCGGEGEGGGGGRKRSRSGGSRLKALKSFDQPLNLHYFTVFISKMLLTVTLSPCDGFLINAGTLEAPLIVRNP